MSTKRIHRLSKPALFTLLGALGCGLGWAFGEPLLFLLKPSGKSAGTQNAAPVLLFNNELTKRLERESAKSGEVQISLMWDNRNDIDLHCMAPGKEHIFFGQKRVKSGGELDVDMNAREPYSDKPVENIYWPTGGAPPGHYVIQVHHYEQHDKVGPTPFTVGLKANGKVQEFKGVARPDEPAETIYSFDLKPPSEKPARGDKPAAAKVPLATTLTIGVWTALLATFLSLCIVAGQNRLLRRPWWNRREALRLTGGGVLAGMLAGGASQHLFSLVALPLMEKFPEATWLVKIGQVFGWMLLGALLGAGLAGFIPNLPRGRASLGGLLGGLLGALAFLVAIKVFGEVAGRLLGALILGGAIGLMVALIEKLAREAALIVHWDPNERTVISLGNEPVILGSSPEAHLYLPKEKGFPPVTAIVTFRGGKVEMENKLTNSTHTLRGGNKLEIGTLMIEIQTDE